MSDDKGPAPSRRALREQRRAEAARKAESGTGTPRDMPDVAVVPEAGGAPAVPSAPERSTLASGEATDGGKRPERSSLQRARNRAEISERRRLAAANVKQKSPDADGEPGELTRRQLRLQALAASKEAGTGPEGAAGDASAPARESRMSVEEALAARSQVAEGPQQPSSPHEDLALLARQRELAARAAVINRRAAERQKLEQAHSQRMDRVRTDPFTGSLQAISNPAAEKALANTGIQGPATLGFKLDLTGNQDAVPAVAEPAPGRPSPGYVELPAAVPEEPRAGKSAAPAEGADAAPVRAVRAQGLDPLDYLTAGARRANLMALVVVGALAVGGAAFVVGLIMFLSSR